MKNRAPFILLTTAVGVTLGTKSATAQNAAWVAAIHQQTRVRIQDTSGSRVEVREPYLSGDVLIGVAWPDGRPVNFHTSEIRQIWHRKSAAGTGFATGAVVGAVGGALAGAAFANFCIYTCRPTPTSQTVKGAVAGAASGALVFGLTGALLAAPFKRWKSVYKSNGTAIRPLVDGNRVGVRVGF